MLLLRGSIYKRLIKLLPKQVLSKLSFSQNTILRQALIHEQGYSIHQNQT